MPPDPRMWRERGGHLVLPEPALARLEDMGVAVAAEGDSRDIACAHLAAATGADATGLCDAYLDYLDVNARRGPRGCVSLDTYIMDGDRDTLVPRILNLAAYANVVICGSTCMRPADARWPLLVEAASVAHAARELRGAFPCDLHGHGACPHPMACPPFPGFSRLRALYARVPAREGELDPGNPGGVRDVLRRLLDAVPPPRWRADDHASRAALARLVACAHARTCEEAHAILQAIEPCRTASQMLAGARNPGWVASRVLETPQG